MVGKNTQDSSVSQVIVHTSHAADKKSTDWASNRDEQLNSGVKAADWGYGFCVAVRRRTRLMYYNRTMIAASSFRILVRMNSLNGAD
jgi:hypothetical protein